MLRVVGHDKIAKLQPSFCSSIGKVFCVAIMNEVVDETAACIVH